MEGKKSSGTGASASSFVDDLLGKKNPVPVGKSSSSSALFDSVFPPVASTVMGSDSSRLEILGLSRKEETGGQALNAQNATADGISQGRPIKGDSINKKNSIYQEEKIEPCYLSSSLYYGGQDFYPKPASSPSSSYNNKKDEEDDSDSSNAASRGNWWKGSLYY